ncbi:uncharacterized protein LOC131844698 [Achroia grisella]|uniref:uncharacterized protein LOC131844698 n=1 Tax=Achroia grisella TaxID=688607 RepID=UPI0027D1EB49|nr:uncharacterized protein LOC131844698 [Achroia grisella]
MNKHAPAHFVRVKRQPAPWITEVVRIAMRKRDRAFRIFKRDRCEENRRYFKIARNRCNYMVRAAKRRYIHSNIQNSSSANIWKFLKSLGLCNQPNDFSSHFSVNELNRHFSTVPALNNSQKSTTLAEITSWPRLSVEFLFSPVTDDEVYKIISSIKTNSIAPTNLAFVRDTALLKITEDVREGMEQSKLTVLVLIDFSNAFNTVDHDVLLAILSHLGISSSVVKWFGSYLRGRQQAVRANQTLSDWCDLVAGVPQGGRHAVNMTTNQDGEPDTLKTYWDHFFKAETGTYEKSTWLDLFLAEFLIRYNEGANPKELIKFCPVSGVVTLVGCELLCGIHRVTSSINTHYTVPLPYLDTVCSGKETPIFQQSPTPTPPGKTEESRVQPTSLFTIANSQSSTEILRKYLLGGIAWRCLILLRALGVEGLSCCRQLSSVLIWLYGELSGAPSPAQHRCLSPASTRTPIHQLFSHRIWSQQKPVGSQGSKVDSAASSEKGSVVGRSRHGALIRADVAESKSKRKLPKNTDPSTEESDSNGDLQILNRSITIKVCTPDDGFDYFNTPVRSSTEYPIETLYSDPYSTPLKAKPKVDDYMTDKHKEILNTEITTLEFVLIIIDLLQELCKAESSLSGAEGSQISVQCINFSLRNLCSLQFGSAPAQSSEGVEEASETKVALTELLIVSLDKVLVHSDLCVKLINNGILPMLLRILEDVVCKSSSKYRKNDNHNRAKPIQTQNKTESENLLKFVFGISYSITAFFHCLLMQCRSVDKLREFTEQFKLYAECLKGGLLKDCIELMIRIPDVNQEETVTLIKKLVETIGKLVCGMKRVRSEVIHSAACPRTRHKMCRKRLAAGMHHHHDILGEASIDLPMASACCISVLYGTLTAVVIDDEVSAEPTLRNKILKVMLNCGVCCCFSPGTLMESIVRLMLTHNNIASLCLQLLEHTVYGELGASVLIPKVTDQLPCSICEPCDNKRDLARKCSHGISPMERKSGWSFLIHYNSLLQLDNHNNVLHATVSHLLRVTPKCRTEMKYELLFSVIYPSFIVAKHRYILRLEESAYFLTVSCLNIFASLLNSISFAEQFIQKGGLSYVLELVSLSEFSNQCCSILEIAIIVEIFKLMRENSDVMYFREISTLASVQMLFKSLSDMTERCYKIFRLKLTDELYEELSDLTKENEMLEFTHASTENVQTRNISVPQLNKSDFSSSDNIEESIEDYIEVLKNIWTFWKTCADLCLYSPMFREYVVCESVFVDSYGLLKLLLHYLCHCECGPAETRILIKIMEALLTVQFAVSDVTSGRSKETSCGLIRLALSGVEEAEGVRGEGDGCAGGGGGGGLQAVCEALLRVSAARPSLRHTMPALTHAKVPPLSCASGGSSACGGGSSSEESAPAPAPAPYASDEHARPHAPDDGYEADVEISKLDMTSYKLKKLSESLSSIGSNYAGVQNTLESTVDCCEYTKNGELAHPELCMIVVDILIQLIQKLAGEAGGGDAGGAGDAGAAGARRAARAVCGRLCGRLARARRPPAGLLRRLLAPPVRALLVRTHPALEDLQRSILELIHSAASQSISPVELGELLKLLAAENPPLDLLLPALQRLAAAATPNSPDCFLTFPVEVHPDNVQMAEDDMNLSANCQVEAHTRKLRESHIAAGVTSAWSRHAARGSAAGAGWAAWQAGFAALLWLRLQRPAPAPQPPRSPHTHTSAWGECARRGDVGVVAGWAAWQAGFAALLWLRLQRPAPAPQPPRSPHTHTSAWGECARRGDVGVVAGWAAWQAGFAALLWLRLQRPAPAPQPPRSPHTHTSAWGECARRGDVGVVAGWAAWQAGFAALLWLRLQRPAPAPQPPRSPTRTPPHGGDVGVVAGWAAWQAGFAALLWLRLQRPAPAPQPPRSPHTHTSAWGECARRVTSAWSRSSETGAGDQEAHSRSFLSLFTLIPDDVDEWQEEWSESESPVASVRAGEPLHVLSVGHDSLMFEMWLEPATGMVVFRVSRAEGGRGGGAVAEGRAGPVTSHRWHCIALNVTDRLIKRRLHVQVTMYVDGYEHETVSLPIQGILVRKATPSHVLLGHAGGATGGATYQVSGVHVYRGPLLTRARALHLAAHGPHHACQVHHSPHLTRTTRSTHCTDSQLAGAAPRRARPAPRLPGAPLTTPHTHHPLYSLCTTHHTSHAPPALLTALTPNSRALHLAAHGPHHACQIRCETPNYSLLLTPELLDSDMDWDQMYEITHSSLRELHDGLLLTFSAQTPSVLNVYQQIVTLPTVFGSRVGACGAPPAAVRVVWAGAAPGSARGGLAPALLLLGGPQHLLYLFARVVELQGSAEQQAAALSVAVRAGGADGRLVSALLAPPALDMLLAVLAAPACRPSHHMLKVILDAACSAPLLIISGGVSISRGDAALIEPRLLVLLLRAWKHLDGPPDQEVQWEEEGRGPQRGSVWALTLRCVCALLRDDHPRREFNLYQMQRLGLLAHLLLVCKERYLNSACGAMCAGASASVVQAVRALLGAPPAPTHLAHLADFLLLMHQASDTFVTHSRANFYFLLTPETPEMSDFMNSAAIKKHRRSRRSENTPSNLMTSLDDLTSDNSESVFRDIENVDKLMEKESIGRKETTKQLKGIINKQIKERSKRKASSASENSDTTVERSDEGGGRPEVDAEDENKTTEAVSQDGDEKIIEQAVSQRDPDIDEKTSVETSPRSGGNDDEKSATHTVPSSQNEKVEMQNTPVKTVESDDKMAGEAVPGIGEEDGKIADSHADDKASGQGVGKGAEDELNEYIVVDVDEIQHTTVEMYTSGIYQQRRVRAGAGPGWAACEGLLLVLRDALLALTDHDFAQTAGGAVSAESLAVLANHRAAAVRAAVVRALAALQRRAPPALQRALLARHYYVHLANQISLYESSWELAAACASLITKCDVPLEDQLHEDIWADVGEGAVQYSPPLLALLPVSVHDPPLVEQIALLLHRVIDKASARLLSEVCAAEAIVRAVRAAARRGVSPALRSLHALLAHLARRLLAAHHAPQTIVDIHHMLTYVEMTADEDEAGTRVRVAARDAQISMFNAQLDYLEERLHSSYNTHTKYSNYFTTVLSTAVSRGAEGASRSERAELAARHAGAVTRAVGFLVAPPPRAALPSPAHAALVHRLLATLLQGHRAPRAPRCPRPRTPRSCTACWPRCCKVSTATPPPRRRLPGRAPPARRAALARARRARAPPAGHAAARSVPPHLPRAVGFLVAPPPRAALPSPAHAALVHRLLATLLQGQYRHTSPAPSASWSRPPPRAALPSPAHAALVHRLLATLLQGQYRHTSPAPSASWSRPPARRAALARARRARAPPAGHAAARSVPPHLPRAVGFLVAPPARRAALARARRARAPPAGHAAARLVPPHLPRAVGFLVAPPRAALPSPAHAALVHRLLATLLHGQYRHTSPAPSASLSRATRAQRCARPSTPRSCTACWPRCCTVSSATADQRRGLPRRAPPRAALPSPAHAALVHRLLATLLQGQYRHTSPAPSASWSRPPRAALPSPAHAALVHRLLATLLQVAPPPRAALPSPAHAALVHRLLATLLQAVSGTGASAPRPKWWVGSGAVGEWVSPLQELFWWAASGAPAVRPLQPALLRALYAAPPHVPRLLTPPDPSAMRKLAVYLLTMLQHMHAAAAAGAATVELAITDWARGWAVSTQAGLPARLPSDALLPEAAALLRHDRDRWARAAARHRPAVAKVVFGREGLSGAVTEAAMGLTRSAVEAQNAARKEFLDHLRRDLARRAAASQRWRRLVADLTHQQAVWHDPSSYPQSWQLDPTEGPGRVRVRLRRAHLRIHPRFLKPEHQHKAERSTRAAPLEAVVGGAAGARGAAARLQPHETLAHSTRAAHVTVARDNDGDLLLTDRCLHFVPDGDTFSLSLCEGEAHSWPLARVAGVATRRWCLQERAVELFLSSGHAHLLAFPAEPDRAAFLRALAACHLPARSEPDTLSEAMSQWRSGNITNWEYLMRLNGLGGRTYNDLMQYPVFPFVIADYTSRILDLNNPASFRDLTKPMGVQNKNREQHYINTYNDLCAARRTGCSALARAPHHYASLYSNSGGVLHYLVRLPPFTELFLNYQDNNFDMPDRTFHSLATTWRLITNDSPTDVKELIPELFYLPELYYNNEGLSLGVRQCGAGVDAVQLPAWAADARLFTLALRQALEAPLVTDALPHWIDLVFGYKQTGQPAIDAINVFPACTYYGFDPLALEDEVDRTAAEAMVRTYGQAPRQLLRHPHPHRAPDLHQREHHQPSVWAGVEGARWGRWCGSPGAPPPAVRARRSLSAAAGAAGAAAAAGGGGTAYALPHARTAAFSLATTALLTVQGDGGTAGGYAIVSWGHADHIVRLRRRRDAPYELLLQVPPLDQITCVATCADTQTAFVGHGSGRVVALEPSGRARTLAAHAARVSALHVCLRAALLASADTDGRLVLWDLNQLTYIRTLPNRDMLPVTHVTVSETLCDVASVHDPARARRHVPAADVTSAAASDVTGADSYEHDADKYQSLIRVHTVNGSFVGSVKVAELVTSVCYSNAYEGVSVNCVVAGLRGGGVLLYSSWDLRRVAVIPPAEHAPLISVTYSSDSQLLFGLYGSGVAVAWESAGEGGGAGAGGAAPRLLPAHALL